MQLAWATDLRKPRCAHEVFPRTRIDVLVLAPVSDASVGDLDKHGAVVLVVTGVCVLGSADLLRLVIGCASFSQFLPAQGQLRDTFHSPNRNFVSSVRVLPCSVRAFCGILRKFLSLAHNTSVRLQGTERRSDRELG